MTSKSVDGEFRAGDWDTYKMATRDPFVELEPLADEIAVVDEALGALVAAGMLPHASYDGERFAAHRSAVREAFEIPWTAITPRQERLIWAISAIAQPARMVAAGVFCGFTFICNAGAAAGPGATYQAEDLVGVEIKPEEAEPAEAKIGRAHV